MTVTLELSEASLAAIAAHGVAAGRVVPICAAGLMTAGSTGVSEISRALVMGELGIRAETQSSGRQGLASGVDSWPVDMTIPMIGLGVPANHPAAAYAGIQERGGTIVPKTARALIVPLNDEARRAVGGGSWGPANRLRQIMPDLVLIPGKGGKAAILARKTGDELEPMFALMRSVTLPASRWLSRGVQAALAAMTAAMESRINDELKTTGT